ncbi:nuclear transport factor 2 family protein [Oxalobacteraceae bacterium R-40]|uniref:Nuclear transport factor 2 family protein n=1 Tax=Keguizhuia sedimenti TaxID=3064264 RepID=A0ABU1BND2_9BURK|nr:nuclear transport factor 2 family protein [Oxalobacteraceae bacterium R-40]
MDERQIKGLADRFIGQLHQLERGGIENADAIAELFADDAELSNSIIEADGSKSQRGGREEIARFWREYRESFQAIRSEFSNITANDHSAGLFWTSDGSDANGRSLHYEGVSLLSFDESGKIKNFKAYFDQAQLH